jgi:hypothetical protein
LDLEPDVDAWKTGNRFKVADGTPFARKYQGKRKSVAISDPLQPFSIFLLNISGPAQKSESGRFHARGLFSTRKEGA